jgi:uncharacterized protein (TIGR03118 family)
MKMTRAVFQCRRFLNLIVIQAGHTLSNLTLVLAAVVLGLSANPVQAQNAYVQSNLVSDIPGLAAVTDPNLVNPWGISFTATSPFWIADNGPGLSTLYNGAGAIQALVVTIPPPAGQPGPSAPSGTIANSVAGFLGTGTATAHFLFSTEDGTISAWSGGSAAVLKVDYSVSIAVFKGLANGVSGGSNYIYATDFHNGQIDVFDTNYQQATLAGSFTDANLPAGYAPFGIQNINGQLFVTFALQDAEKHDDVGGPGNGYVDIFDTSGNLIQRFAVRGSLNSPWGLAIAPLSFGPFAGDILVGNFGDGRINAFDPLSGEWLGAVNDSTGVPFAEPGLWAIAFGNGHSGGSTHTLYFTAGINDEGDGLFGSLAPVYPNSVSGTSYAQSNLVSDIPGLAAVTDSNLVNPWGISFSPTGPFWLADNGTGLSTLYNGAGAIQALVVTIPPPAGQPGPSAPSGTIANSVAGFLGTGSATAHFLFSTEDGTISAWSGGSVAVLKVDYSTSNAVFKGLANGVSGGSNYIYATDFHNGQIDVFDTNYAQVALAGSFSDTNLPAGFAPFGIQNINGQIFVTFALQDAEKHDDVGGQGNGYVDVFDTSGNLVQRLITQSVLNSPWGLALAPVGFGAYGGDLLVGNFSDGRINVFNPTTGTWLGELMNSTNGEPFEVPGLWGIAFGNGHSAGDAHTLYFTAGINDEGDGLFGSLAAITPTFTGITNSGSSITLSWAGGGTGPFVVQENTDLSSTNWVPVVTTSNLSVTISITNQNGFFRLLNQGN